LQQQCALVQLQFVPVSYDLPGEIHRMKGCCMHVNNCSVTHYAMLEKCFVRHYRIVKKFVALPLLSM
jgi:hypothetical protein